MIFDNIISSRKEMDGIDRSNPNNVVIMLIHVLCNYNPHDTSNFYDMLSYLLGEYQPISSIMKQNILDRMLQNDKYEYIGKSYFEGAIPDNDYTPSSYKVDVIENKYSRSEEGYIRLMVKSGGADEMRTVTLRLSKDGNYYVWGDTFMSLLADIRPGKSSNPWI